MARSRNIKPSFFSNDLLADIEPLGRLLFIGLWTIADCKGNLEWRDKRIKAQILPYDNCDIKEIAINLDNLGFIRFYSDGDKILLNITNFDKHQNPHKNERDKGSDIVDYSENARQVVDLTTLAINPDKTRLNRNDSTCNRADSFNLIPDSPILIPDSGNPNAAIENDSDSAQSRFDEFWKLYPNKQDKKKAQAVYKKLNPDAALHSEIIHGLIDQLEWRQEKPEREFVAEWKLPTTWLNGENWNDELKPWTSQKSIGQNVYNMIDKMELSQ